VYIEARSDQPASRVLEGTLVEELIKMVADRVGIDESKAKMAVDLVISQLKHKLPGPIGDQLESALDGDGGGPLGGLGGALGR